MLAGAFASAIIGGLSAYKAQSLPLLLCAIAFVVIGTIRYIDMRSFWRAGIGNEDAATAEHWENRAVVIGGALAAVYGIWCYISMAIEQDPFAALASASISIAVMVGICARNFGLDRLVTIQMLAVILPLSLGYSAHGDVYHLVLAALLGMMLVSFRKLAADIRSILLSAVHGRVEASRLASELDMSISILEHGLCMLDENGRIAVINKRAVRLFGLVGLGDLLHQTFDTVTSRLSAAAPLSRETIEQLSLMVASKTSGKILLHLPPGYFYEITVSTRNQRVVLLFEDISERIASEERITFLARHDTLTNLPNRSHFGDLIEADLAARRTTPEPARPVALMLVDIDDFKHVNDSFGHVAGDTLLAQVARRMREHAPPDAVLARLGGDEFIIYCRNLDSDDEAETVARTIVDSFGEPFVFDGVTLPVNVSIGLVTSTAVTDQLDDLMTKADLALYAAKADGKGRTQVFHTQMDIDYHYRQRLKTDLALAVRQGQLTLAFQPLLDICSRKVVSCEALARWQHPQLGAIPPATFIPLAEEMGLISDITAWVIEEAAAQCVLWPGEISVAVNVSARDFRGADLEALVRGALERTGLAPARFEIEVTETAVIEQHETAQRVLQRLADQGIAIALDDFGTGYSSLSYLNALPFTKLKIDRSFVADITTNPRALRLLANVARLGRDLDLTVIAEGVETEDQLNIMLGHTQVQQVQGYLFSRPLPQRDIGELIARLNTAPRRLGAKRRHG
ncbi:EAL domain-containing protein [Devosia sp. FKR38]|uniref:putative bifunctional diguanylate cyclase/phosphodiesterase n=1 Tax=Devosia sp. FKR38 TaxID=2562312 RepID=UPI0014858371|nr:EAL domain-containing protein [Devosia sp. FKR38]